MSQMVVEAVLGRLITDAEFRRRFFTGPAETCQEYGLALTSRELAALLGTDAQALREVAGCLDPKIVRGAALPTGGPPAERAAPRAARADWRRR